MITNNKRRDDLADFGVVKWYSRLWGLVVTHVLPALPGRQAFALADPVWHFSWHTGLYPRSGCAISRWELGLLTVTGLIFLVL